MSTKNLFDKGKSYKVLSSVDPATLGLDAESFDNIQEVVKDKNRFIPNVDFSDASNFVRYGSAKKYYESAFDRIRDEFPYDGSGAEKQEFFNNSSYLDLYVYDNDYPKTTGYVILSADGWGTQASETLGWGVSNNLEYIELYGGPHTSSNGMIGKSIHSEFSASNIYDTDIYDTQGVLPLGKQGTRESNLQFDWTRGQTIEFWLKKDEFIDSLTEKEVIFDLWNGETTGSENPFYGRLTLYLTGATSPNTAPFRFNLMSGTTGFHDVNFDLGLTKAQVSDGTWRHYAFTFKNNAGQSTIDAYVNGVRKQTLGPLSLNILEVTGALRARIGALTTAPSGNVYHGINLAGAAKLSASLDEFRYWKVDRTHEEVAKNYFRGINGGTNTDVSNTELGVYYKFNEGITSNSSTDAVVLDYSGRITNGNWVGYPGSTARNTGSAIVSASAASFETPDPIIYATHSDVISVRERLSNSGSAYDYQNNSSIYYTLPSWIIEEEEEKGGEILNLTQIIGSYFDTLHSQIAEIPRLKDISYVSSSFKAYPFSSRLLESNGIFAPEVFVDASVLEQFSNQSETELYEKDLSEIKNLIYKNIYNNLVYIFKSKGTEKSFRNVIRCYGVDDELIKINMYGNNVTHKLRDNFRYSVSKKKFADFSRPSRFGATVTHQSSSANVNTLDVTYLSCSSNASTAEVEVLFPRKPEQSDVNYFSTSFLSSSIFGWHRVNTSNHLDDYGWYATDSADRSLQVYLVRPSRDSRDGHFVLRNRQKNIYVTSSVYQNIYDDTKWNLAVKTYLDKKDQAEKVSGSSGTAGESDIIFELFGCNVELGVVKNQFSITASLAQSSTNNGYLSNPRRYYIGAHRQNFTASVQQYADTKITSLRHWSSFLKNSEVVAHARNSDSYGLDDPFRSTFLYDTDLEGNHIPKIETLALHWNFEDVTTSDGNGEFLVNDSSSGSIEKRTRYPGNFGQSVGNQYTGRGYFFPTNETASIAVEYLQTAVQSPPEVVTSYDMTNIATFDDETFVRDSRTINHFVAIEKSMYQTVSEEMLKMFSTIVGFNNLIGEPVNRYRQDYKDLNKLRSLFFEKVENVPDLDKYVDFYRWIDSSLSIILKQLIPASANTSDDIRTMIESHVLERSKYYNKFPTIDLRRGELQVGANGVNTFVPEEMPNWTFAHAPVSNLESDNSVYWAYAEATHPVLSSSDAGVNATRAAIIRSKVTDKARRASLPVKMSISLDSEDLTTTKSIRRKVIHGGTNLPAAQKPSAFISLYSSDYTGADLTTVTRKNNFRNINDVLHPMEKKYFSVEATQLLEDSKGANYIPFRLLSGTLAAGYNSGFEDFQITNIHSFESYLVGGETPMQSPFTEKHVGGFASRHTDISDGSDTKSNRAETYHLSSNSTGVTFRGPGNANFGDTNPRSLISRNVKVKRPVNLENIQISGSMALGNYSNIREVVLVSGRASGDSQFIRNEGVAVTNITSTQVSGIVDTQVEFLSSSEHMMIERFSSPGGPETAHGALDSATTQYSVYNSLNYRNLPVRIPLRTLLSASTSQFGFKPGVTPSYQDYRGVANYHKVNRNTARRIVYSNEFTGALGTVATGTVNDNAFITRPIPQSDLQYSWLTASYESTALGGSRRSGRVMLGYAPRNFEVSTSAGFVNAITFNSQSDYTETNNTSLVDSPSRLSILVRDPVSSSTQTLGFPLGTHVGTFDSPYIKVEVSPDQALRAAGSDPMSGITPAVFYNRGYTFGYTTWKQIRGAEHPVAQALRESHIVSVETPDKQSYTVEGRVLPAQRYGKFKQFRESPIISKYKPIVQQIDGYDIESSYTNNISYFSNLELNNITERQPSEQVYDRMKRLYPDGYEGFVYKETIYPAEKNAFSNRNRERQGYKINFWHSDRQTRDDNKADKVSFGGRSKYSIWSLDTRTTFETYNFQGVKAINDGTNPPGELQNFGGYAHFTTDKASLTASALYAHKHFMATSASVVAPSGIVVAQTSSAVGTGNNIFGKIDIGNGNAKWQAGELAGRIKNGVFVSGSTDRSNPAYDSYQDYAEELRVHGKDYSIVPEFRISDHIDYYVSTMSNNFLADNSSSLSIFGASGSSDNPADSSYEQFYNVYANSDFLKYFDIVKSEHSDISRDSNITLTCKALMKFLPYNGFYPAERTLQMATQFSASYMDYVNFTGTDSTYENARVRPFLEALYAPGIVYNSIKSGIGIPYPVLTSSAEVQLLGDDYYALSASDSSNNLRLIDFEAAVEPEKYLSNVPIHDPAPHPFASLNVTASWDGHGDPLYRMMANNFFGECPEFFLRNSNMTTITSLPESDPRFGNAVSGNVYCGRIRMYRSMNKARTSPAAYDLPQDNPLQEGLHETFTMYSRPSAFYHPVTGRNSLAQTDHDGTYAQRMLDSYSGYNWVGTPPYYHGEAWLDVQFTATETKKYTLAEILGNIDGQLNLRFDTTEAFGNDAGFYHTTLGIRQNIIDLKDVLITDGRVRIKSVSYDPNTGEALEVSDDPTANHVAMVIQPKWETPMFNFAPSAVNIEGNLTLPTYGSESVPRGMWHQFGLPPDSPDKGIFLQFTDVPQDWLNNHPNVNANFYGNGNAKSFVDLLGFDQNPRRLGEVAEAKEVREAIVAIPFVEENGQKVFFNIPDEIVKSARANELAEDNSVQNMFNKMKNYVFPPKLDFDTNQSIQPFAMYIFEFTHKFDKDDLTHMWQNLPPNSVERVEKKEVSFSHPLLHSELLGQDGLPERLQWMVFKVKQKAVKNYFSKVASKSGGNIDDDRYKFEFTIGGSKTLLDYSYNWPYDFFSLVEMVKIEATVESEAIE